MSILLGRAARRTTAPPVRYPELIAAAELRIVKAPGPPMHQAASDRYERIAYARCGRSGLRLPRISLGLWQNFGGSTPFENAREMVLKSFDHGITHFDLANNYGPPPGSAEEHFGRVLAADLASHRGEVVVSTKAGSLMWPGPYGEWGSRKYLLARLEQSLKR